MLLLVVFLLLVFFGWEVFCFLFYYKDFKLLALLQLNNLTEGTEIAESSLTTPHLLLLPWDPDHPRKPQQLNGNKPVPSQRHQVPALNLASLGLWSQ